MQVFILSDYTTLKSFGTFATKRISLTHTSTFFLSNAENQVYSSTELGDYFLAKLSLY